MNKGTLRHDLNSSSNWKGSSCAWLLSCSADLQSAAKPYSKKRWFKTSTVPILEERYPVIYMHFESRWTPIMQFIISIYYCSHYYSYDCDRSSCTLLGHLWSFYCPVIKTTDNLITMSARCHRDENSLSLYSLHSPQRCATTLFIQRLRFNSFVIVESPPYIAHS